MCQVGVQNFIWGLIEVVWDSLIDRLVSLRTHLPFCRWITAAFTMTTGLEAPGRPWERG